MSVAWHSMRLLRGTLLAHLTGALVAALGQPTSGNHSIAIKDPNFGTVIRQYVLTVPNGSAPAGGMPLIMGFHGQGNSPWVFAPRKRINPLVQEFGWVAVYPVGIRDTGDTGWNVGAAGDNATCLANTSGTQCMDTCRQIGKCGRCNWSTCYDDVAFIVQLLKALEEMFHLDQKRYFVVGGSNGGMFVHHLITSLPGRFRAAAPVFGVPMLGYITGSDFQLVKQPDLARQTSIIALHDRSDDTIPWQGGPSSAGWVYESLNRTMGVWAALHKCLPAATPTMSPYSGGPSHIDCREFGYCENGKRVMFCMYDGTHGMYPPNGSGVDLIWWFFQSVGGAPNRLETNNSSPPLVSI